MKSIVPIVLTLAALSTASMAQEVKVGIDRYAVSVAQADLGSATSALAHRALHRLDRAATAACGGGGGSLREVTKAVQASVCWREAIGDTVRRIDAPLLTQAAKDRFGRRLAHD